MITDVNDYRLGIAKKMGATRVVNVTCETLDDVMRELGMKEGFDVGPEMSGIYGCEMFETWYKTAALLQERARHHAGDDAPLRSPDDGVAPVGQIHPRLDRAIIAQRQEEYVAAYLVPGGSISR